MHGNHRQTHVVTHGSCSHTRPGVFTQGPCSYMTRTRGEPRSLPGSLPADLNHHLRHRTRTLTRSLRRTDLIRIITHNASEPSLSDLGVLRPILENPKRGFETPDALSRSDINRSSGTNTRQSPASIARAQRRTRT